MQKLFTIWSVILDSADKFWGGGTGNFGREHSPQTVSGQNHAHIHILPEGKIQCLLAYIRAKQENLLLFQLHRTCWFLTECRRGLAMRILSVRLSVRRSVCLSVCLSVTRVNFDKTVERFVQIYIPYER